jgi:hypothetical protein
LSGMEAMLPFRVPASKFRVLELGTWNSDLEAATIAWSRNT